MTVSASGGEKVSHGKGKAASVESYERVQYDRLTGGAQCSGLSGQEVSKTKAIARRSCYGTCVDWEGNQKDARMRQQRCVGTSERGPYGSSLQR
jgi:hypothetical protein